MSSSSLREFASVPDRHTRLSKGVERFDDGRVCVIQGTVWASVSGVRVAPDEVAGLVEQVRALVPPEKHTAWWIDEDAEPADLHDRLLAAGLQEPADGIADLAALACVEEPGQGPDDVEVRSVGSFDEYLLATEVMWRAFETPPHRIEQQRPQLRTEYDDAVESGSPATFVAYIDGRPAGLARSIYSDLGVFLIAGAVDEWARGRGVYRSLVRARWDDAVARGTPALVTEANPATSYPILTRLGFVDVCAMRRLEDVR
jgi:hypothetical protein